MTREADEHRAAYANLERKQSKFDRMLAEEKEISGKLATERQQIERESREKETRILTLQKELDELKEKFGELERVRGTQQKELDELVSSKDDAGKNVSTYYLIHFQVICRNLFKTPKFFVENNFCNFHVVVWNITKIFYHAFNKMIYNPAQILSRYSSIKLNFNVLFSNEHMTDDNNT